MINFVLFNIYFYEQKLYNFLIKIQFDVYEKRKKRKYINSIELFTKIYQIDNNKLDNCSSFLRIQ